MRLLKATPPGQPPAVWAAFARQAAWKSWVIAAQLVIIVLLILAGMRLAAKEPDVVLIAPDGKSTFVSRSVAGEALQRFLAEQRQQPSDVTVAHFSREFLQLALAMNSSTVDATWTQAMALMSPELRAGVTADAENRRLVESAKVARIRTELTIEDLVLAERTPTLLHVRARVSRRRGSLLDDSGATSLEDRLKVELVERVVPRSPARPDGLEVADWRIVAAPPPGKTTTKDADDAR